MNRLLAIPAVCCLVAYVGLGAAMPGKPVENSRPGQNQPSREDATSNPCELDALAPNCNALLTVNEAQQLVTSLVGEYQRPWHQWQSSPHRLYSRAAPRPAGSISADIQWASADANPGDRMLLATIVMQAGRNSQLMPCVIDRASGQASFCADGQWLAANEWLKRAPLP